MCQVMLCNSLEGHNIIAKVAGDCSSNKMQQYSGSHMNFETCSLTLREEHRLTVFENRMLRRICFTSYCLGDQIKEVEMGGKCSMHGDEKCLQNFGQNF
jgi:hypothetical protein